MATKSPPVPGQVDSFGDSGVDPLIEPDARRLADTLGQLIRVVQFRDRDRACCYDISVSQCHALDGVVEAGAMTVNDLAALLYVDKSTASRIANGLVNKNLIVRARAATDGRIVLLVPTEKGATLHRRIQADLIDEYGLLLCDFDPQVRDALHTLVGRLGRSLASRVDTSNGSCCTINSGSMRNRDNDRLE